MVVRTSMPELADAATKLITQRNYGFFYDAETHQMTHGYNVEFSEHSRYHYATLYTEARLGSLIAIGKGDVPEDHWFRMVRTFPPTCTWQSLPPQGRKRKEVRGHAVTGGFGSGSVLLKPASEGTGVIAGGPVRAVITAAGIQNILTKSLGSTTAHNVVKATVDALLRLKQPERVARLRGKSVPEILGAEPKPAATPQA